MLTTPAIALALWLLPPAAVPEYSAEQFYATTSFSAAALDASGKKLLVTSDESGVFNVYEVDIATGSRTALTRSPTASTFAVAYFPADDRVLFTRDEGGNELDHLFVRERDGKEVDLTPGTNSKASFVDFSGDERACYVTTNERDPRFMDLYRYSLEDGYPRARVFENQGGYFPAGVSPDGRLVALMKLRNNADNDLYLYDTTAPDAAPRHVTPHEGDVMHAFADFDPESRTLYFTSDEGGEFARAFAYDVESGAKSLAFDSAWDVSSYEVSRAGRYLVVTVNADARTQLAVIDRRDGKTVELPALPQGDLGNILFSRDESRIAFHVNGDSAPTNLWTLDLATGKSKRLTNSLCPAIDEAHLVEAEVVRYPSFDGLKIPALLYRPHGASAEAKVPAIVAVHGGPGGQSRKGYRAEWQYLVNHGYAVLAVNNRGSSGYGRTFFHLDDRRHGEDDLKDCVHGRKYLESLDWVDGSRVAIMGGSYGGYMVAAALAFEPTAFDAGIDIFGVTNWLRTLESIPAWWEAQRQSLYAELGDPAVDAERLRRISPLFHADKIQRPLLVVQGANDPRVLQVESDELVAAVKKNGVPVEYLVFPDEGHGFEVKKNRIAAAEAFEQFLDSNLPAKPAGDT